MSRDTPKPARRRWGRRARGHGAERPVRLGNVARNGVGVSMAGLVERGVLIRPRLASGLFGCVELHFQGDLAPIRVVFGPSVIEVDDLGGPSREAPGSEPAMPPDLVIRGALPAVVQLASSPLIAGLPNPVTPRGRKALRDLTSGNVRFEGNTQLARNLLRLLEI